MTPRTFLQSRPALAVAVAALSVGTTLAATHLPARAADTHTVNGYLKWGTACGALAKGAAVTLDDQNLRPLAHGTISGKPFAADGGCVAPFRVPGVAEADAYVLQVGNDLMHSSPVEGSELQAENWTMFVRMPGAVNPAETAVN